MSHNIRLEIYDYFLIFGLITASMTKFRLFYIGISEILLFLFMIVTIIKYNKNLIMSNTSFLFLIMIISMIFGTVFGTFRQTSIEINYYEVFNFSFLFIFVFSLENYWKNRKPNIKLILKKYTLYSLIILGFLFLWTKFVGHNILFWDLYFGGSRLSLLAENPHQLVRSTGVLIILSFMFLYEEKKIIYFIAIIIFTLISIETKSSTFLATIVFLIIIYVAHYIYDKTNIAVILILVSLSFIILLSNLEHATYRINQFIESDPNGEERLLLWKTAFIQSRNYFIFGNGFGPQLEFGSITKLDVHNTLLDILLRGGLISLVIFLIIMFQSFKKTFFNKKHFFYIVLYFLLYGIAGVVMRNQIFWFFIFLSNNNEGDLYERNYN